MNSWSWYWLVWFLSVTVSFSIPESAALIMGQPRNTFSWQVWNMFGDDPSETPLTYSALHVLVGGALMVLLIWLIGHLVFGLWR